MMTTPLLTNLLNFPHRRRPTDAELYEVASLPRNEFNTNRPNLDIYGRRKDFLPQGIEVFEFEAYRIYDKDNPDRLFEVATDDGFGKTTTRIFKIAFTRWGWNNTDGPFILLNHGVPANMQQKYYLALLLAMAGFRVVIFDMLTMGRSSKPLFNNQEKLDKLRWHNDRIYVQGLADAVFGPGMPFIYGSDDWGVGIMLKYLELYSQRVIWFRDQDGIRGRAYPIPEIDAVGKASMLPMDERPEVLAGQIPPAAGTFQAVMAASGQTFTQILKTMAWKQNEFYDQWGMRDILDTFFSQDYERDDLDPRGRATPLTMPYRFYALKSMADRSAAALITGDLMPFHPTKNKFGIKYTQVRTIGVASSGEYDNMMSRNQRLRYPYWMYNSRIFTSLVPRAGHFAEVDNPEWIASEMVAFHMMLFPPGTPGALPAKFLGFNGIWFGNEEAAAKGYQRLFDS